MATHKLLLYESSYPQHTHTTRQSINLSKSNKTLLNKVIIMCVRLFFRAIYRPGHHQREEDTFFENITENTENKNTIHTFRFD
jgi:hypothetical protein